MVGTMEVRRRHNYMLTKLRVLSVTGPTVVELRANFISLSFEDYRNHEGMLNQFGGVSYS